MPTRYRQIYNIWNVYAGSAPATGYHYSDYNNEGHNNPQLTIFDNNLLQQIDRINSFQYSFTTQKENITQLGNRGLTNRAIVNRPEIRINFNYWIAGVSNESKLGLVVNYPDITGHPILDSDICCISNFTGQNTDYRNIFVAVAPDNNDLNERIGDAFSTLEGRNDINPSGLFVFGFGNCYLTSYNINASVAQIPQASVEYVCDNIIAHSSGSGVNIPAIHSKSGNLVHGIKFTIPRAESYPSPSILRPSDIIFKIQENNIETKNAIFGFSSSGMAIQSCDIRMNLDRENMRSIGHAATIDRRLNFPVLVDIGLSSVIDNNISGNLVQILNENKSYNILINMYNPGCEPLTGRHIGMQLKIQNVKYEQTNYRYGLNGNLIGDFSFLAEIDVDNINKGFFISGMYNRPFPEFPFNFLVLENNRSGFLYTEDNNLIIVSDQKNV